MFAEGFALNTEISTILWLIRPSDVYAGALGVRPSLQNTSGSITVTVSSRIANSPSS